MTLTATYDPQLSRVRLTVDGLGDATEVRFERSTNGVTWSTVRGGEAVLVSDGTARLDDYEFAAGVLNTYRAAPILREGFELATLRLDITGTWTRTQQDAYTGAWSLRSGVIPDGGLTDAVVTVPAGATTLSFALRISSEAGHDWFRFFIVGTEYGFNSGEVPWGVSNGLDVTGASYVRFRYEKDGSIAEGADAVFVDDIVFSGFPAQTTTITPQLQQVWIKNIARPFLNRAVVVNDFSNVQRQSRNGVFQVVGRSLPVAVTDVRGSRSYDLVVIAETLAESDDLDLVLAAGDPVFVHVPPNCPVPRSMYAVVGNVSIARRSTRGVRRYHTLPLTEVAPPGPDIVGASITYQGILSAFGTYADLLAANATYEDVVERIGDPGEVIVP
ncbi:hypothetical protein [Prauserella flavalba]|uniref:hypothetical protein n=1 Tax=Prauserella flavalba TaxID=1477506 RepID=UPI0036E4D0BC